jgi:hypothetical protein
MKMIARNASVLGCSLGLVLVLSGCVSSSAKLVSADAVPVYGVDPLYHTVYTGSDERYHYFAWNRGLRGGQLKVDRTQLTLSREFARGASKAFVKRTHDGKIDVMVFTKTSSEPDGAANGSQPIRSETNRTSGAAGSRR